MADLNKLAESLNVNLVTNPNQKHPELEKISGVKRRDWLPKKSDLDNELTSHKETVSNPVENGKQTENNRNENQKTNEEQINGKLEAKISDNLALKTLSGIQYKVIIFFYFLAKKSGDQSTGPISLDYVSTSLKTKIHIIRNSIIRLQKKGYLIRNLGKEGRGGWSTYSLSNNLYKELMQHDNLGYLEQQTGNKPLTTTSSGNYNIYNKTTTDEISALHGLLEQPEKWQSIDYSLLSKFGFTETHVQQLIGRGLFEPEVVQDSIYHFAYDLNHNGKRTSIKGDVVNFFMGILSKGLPYARPANYISPEQLAMQDYLAAKEKEHKETEQIHEKLRELEFRSWYENLSDEALMTIYPESFTKQDSIVPRSVLENLKQKYLHQHFEKTIWPELKRKISNRQLLK